MALIRPVRVEIPHEPGNFITVRGLAGAEAQRARTLGAIRKLEVLGRIQAMQSPGVEAALNDRSREAPTQSAIDAAYDKEATVEAGLLGWDGPLYEQDGAPMPCTADTKRAMLDEAVFDFAFGEILKLTRRPTPPSSD